MFIICEAKPYYLTARFCLNSCRNQKKGVNKPFFFAFGNNYKQTSSVFEIMSQKIQNFRKLVEKMHEVETVSKNQNLSGTQNGNPGVRDYLGRNDENDIFYKMKQKLE